jgi:putative NADH-flavin reductase
MNVLVFGATGPTGSLVVERALAEGHTVTGFTRHSAALQGKHERLRPHAGDVLDAAAVLSAVEGHDAVISAFGVPYDPFHEIVVYSNGTRNIVRAMQEHAVQRYLGVTSGGTSTTPQPGGSALFEWFIKPVFGRTTYADQRRQEEIVMRSSLRWTIARPSRLVNAAATGTYRVEPGYVVPGEQTTVRADLADFLVRALVDPQWEHQAVAIAGRRR